jgi:acetyl-CoA synthetase
MNTTMTDVIWQPSGEYLNCRIVDFMKKVGVKDWKELITRSTEDTDWFWQNALEFMGFQWHKPYDTLQDTKEGFPWTKWFVGGEFNAAYNCLDWHLEAGKQAGARRSVGRDHIALIWEGEQSSSRSLTYGELNDMAGRVAGVLAKLGVKAGDAVGIYMPMVPEVVAVLFGCLKYGAVAVPVFSGFGAQALTSRMDDAKARVLFTSDAGLRKGKKINIKGDADIAAAALPMLEHVVVLKHCNADVKWDEKRDIWFHEIMESVEPLPTRMDLPAEHPSMYLYTSGTTGKPKGCVHTHAGAMAQIAKELGFSFDVQPEDVFFWVTDIGWMMGPWEMMGVSFWGGTMVIFEGAPTYPHPDRIWEIVEKHKVSTLGVSPTAIRVLKAEDESWVKKHDLSSLRMLGSTGEPWDQESYMWFFDKVGGKRCPIINISGGTEVVGCLLLPLPVMPLKACSLGAPGLGMAIDVFDEAGNSVHNSIGHLVCKKPSPSMTKGFLGDSERYIDTYFSKFPGVWYHGDWAKIDEDGSWFLFGRSDDTIKVAGKRVGPGEVESILVEHGKVAEAAVIGVPHEIKGEGLICFIVLGPNEKYDESIEAELKILIGQRLGAVLKPEKIHQLPALPKTRSGKIVRGSIRRAYLGQPVGDTSSIENPDALMFIKAPIVAV